MNQKPKENDVSLNIKQLQGQLTAMNQKLDTFMKRILSELTELKGSQKPTVKPVKPTIKPEERTVKYEKPAVKSGPINPVNEILSQAQQHQGRKMYEIVCNECGKESEIPFKPRGNRPVFCKECFTERKKRKRLVKVIKPASTSQPSQQKGPSYAPIKTAETKTVSASSKTLKTVKKKTPVKKTTAVKKEAPTKKKITAKKTTTIKKAAPAKKKATATKKTVTTKKAPAKKTTTKKATTKKATTKKATTKKTTTNKSVAKKKAVTTKKKTVKKKIVKR